MSLVAIVQSSYIPWKGYFDLIGLADRFVIFDEAQYTKHDWRTRNRIKTAQGVNWLTIPVRHSGRFGQRIDEAVATDGRWRRRHWRTLVQSYSKAPYFNEFADILRRRYLEDDEVMLTRINEGFILEICGALGIDTPIIRSTDVPVEGDRASRLIDLCTDLGADAYLTGPRGRAYLDHRRFVEAGIEIRYMDYADYPEYAQPHGRFEHRVSVLDVLFSTGFAAPAYLKHAGRVARAA